MIVFFAIACNCADAQSSCHLTYSGNRTSWEECIARVNSIMVIASPPEAQKMSVWCWAASLSLIYTAGSDIYLNFSYADPKYYTAAWSIAVQ